LDFTGPSSKARGYKLTQKKLWPLNPLKNDIVLVATLISNDEDVLLHQYFSRVYEQWWK